MRTTRIRVPIPMYNYLKTSATQRNCNISEEAGRLFDKYNEQNNVLKNLEGKNVFVVKKGWSLFK